MIRELDVAMGGAINGAGFRRKGLRSEESIEESENVMSAAR